MKIFILIYYLRMVRLVQRLMIRVLKSIKSPAIRDTILLKWFKYHPIPMELVMKLPGEL